MAVIPGSIPVHPRFVYLLRPTNRRIGRSLVSHRHSPCHRRHLIHWIGVRTLRFPNRTMQVRVAVHIKGCIFEVPGIYLAELYCVNTWVADTTLRLREFGEWKTKHPKN